MTVPISFAERFRRWYDYERDCNAKTMAMLESVPADRQGSAQFQRAVDKMAHLVAARHAWLYRLGKWSERPATFFPPGYSMEMLRPYLRSIEDGWTGYLSSLDDESLHQKFTFDGTDGSRWSWNLLDLLTQVFGHAWYHRGQIATLVKDLGGSPVNTDYIFWCGTAVKIAPAP